MSGRPSRVGLSVTLVLALSACATPSAPEGAVDPSPTASSSPFPVTRFRFDEHAASDRSAGRFDAALREMAGGGGMAVTVMTPDGTWSGASGKADPRRNVSVRDQFAIASVTKSIVATQVMQMVEAGEVTLDDPAVAYLPDGLDFDTNGATVRQLLGHRSGIPDYIEASAVQESLSHEPAKSWTRAELLELVPAHRNSAGGSFSYADTNYLVLGMVIEGIRGQPIADVLRHGVLDVSGTERLVYQPHERPTEPMAMPGGASRDVLRTGGGYLPSLAGATADDAAAAMASDAPSLARWWKALCAGEIVSEASVSAMTMIEGAYGLGVYEPFPGAVGHTGEHVGYVSWAGCLPEEGAVLVVLSNRVVDDIGSLAAPLVAAIRQG